MCPSLIEIG